MVPTLVPEPFHHAEPFVGERELVEGVAERRQSFEKLRLAQRQRLKTELADLTGQVSTLSLERDELLAAVVSLKAKVMDLRSKRQELLLVQSEIQVLRRERSLLDGELLTELRRSTEKFRSPPIKCKVDDS
jgi:uncharacterized coiled-coil DUF342 family protein